MFKRFLSLAAGLVAATGVASAATFSATSAVSDPNLHGGNSDHSVWLPFFESVAGTPLTGNSNGSDFDFSPEGFLTINPDGTGQLVGTIVSQVDPRFAFDVVIDFLGLSGPGSGGPKKELRACAYAGTCSGGAPAVDTDSWDYFSLTGGTLTGLEALAGITFDVSERPRNNVHPMQIGDGANNKNGQFGLSVWFYLTVSGMCDNVLCDEILAQNSLRGDFNLNLTETPLPAGVLLFLTGLAGVGAARRR
ncbi:MAG: VPLPA-CTERM sorting domain-containing protein [Pseudomonadota bacterium]